MDLDEQAPLAIAPVAYQLSQGYRVRFACAWLTSGCPVHSRQQESRRTFATEFSKADRQWNRYRQLNKTVPWLKSLPEQDGVVIARAIRKAGVADCYGPEIGRGRV